MGGGNVDAFKTMSLLDKIKHFAYYSSEGRHATMTGGDLYAPEGLKVLFGIFPGFNNITLAETAPSWTKDAFENWKRCMEEAEAQGLLPYQNEMNQF